MLTFRDKPARRFGEEGNETNDADRENDLESDGDAPRHRAVEIGEAEVDPLQCTMGSTGACGQQKARGAHVGNHRSRRDHGSLNEDGETARLCLSALSVPGGDSTLQGGIPTLGRAALQRKRQGKSTHGEESGSKSSHDSADDELPASPVVVERSYLDQNAEG